MQQYFEIPSLDQTIRKAIVDGIVQRALNESGIAKAEIIYNDERFKTTHQVGSTEGEETTAAYAGTDRAYIGVVEERDEYSRINRQIGLNVNIPFFANKQDQVYAACGTCGYNVTITITRHNQSQDELHRWVNRLDALQDMGRYSLMAESEAYYLIPKPALQLLNACWVAAETRVPTHETFADYLNEYFGDEVTRVANVAGGQESLAVRFAPTRVELVYGTESPEWDKDENHYEASFTIKFYYQPPEEIVISYPYIINQTPMPDVWWPDIDGPWVSNEEFVRRSQQQMQQDATWWVNEKRALIQLPYLMCPIEQFHRLHYPSKATVLPVFGTDVAFDEDNMLDPVVFDVDDLPYRWNDALLPYINHCRRIDRTGMTGMFRFLAFEEGALIEPRLYYWDGDKFQLKRRQSVEKNYFVLETVVSDWRGIDLWPLHLYPKAAEVLIKWLFPDWDTPDWWWDLPRLPPSVIDKIPRDKLKDRDYYLTVFNTGILTIKGEQHAEVE
ncbi:hypothetical protein pEaSNUABM11_00074 [Erwinia phage pEa_SNUABM_11]|nr:hypothetical protein pEaSNUABM11_00074 [Erwinia phage pEa_SNUABM_11]